jgi:hypothetical protein
VPEDRRGGKEDFSLRSSAGYRRKSDKTRSPISTKGVVRVRRSSTERRTIELRNRRPSRLRPLGLSIFIQLRKIDASIPPKP